MGTPTCGTPRILAILSVASASSHWTKPVNILGTLHTCVIQSHVLISTSTSSYVRFAASESFHCFWGLLAASPSLLCLCCFLLLLAAGDAPYTLHRGLLSLKDISESSGLPCPLPLVKQRRFSSNAGAFGRDYHAPMTYSAALGQLRLCLATYVGVETKLLTFVHYAQLEMHHALMGHSVAPVSVSKGYAGTPPAVRF